MALLSNFRLKTSENMKNQYIIIGRIGRWLNKIEKESHYFEHVTENLENLKNILDDIHKDVIQPCKHCAQGTQRMSFHKET